MDPVEETLIKKRANRGRPEWGLKNILSDCFIGQTKGFQLGNEVRTDRDTVFFRLHLHTPLMLLAYEDNSERSGAFISFYSLKEIFAEL